MRAKRGGLLVALMAALTAQQAQGADDAAKAPILTRWGQDVRTQPDFYSLAYPRPQLCRPDGVILDGLWHYAVTNRSETQPPDSFSSDVLVPFSLGSPLSRVSARLKADQQFWCERTLEIPGSWDLTQRRLMLHFKALGPEAIVYLDGKQIASQPRPAEPLSIDITDEFKSKQSTPHRLTVALKASSSAGSDERGSDERGKSKGVVDGVLQTIWLEPLPAERIEKLELVPDLDKGQLNVTATCTGDVATQRLEVVAFAAASEVARGSGAAGTKIVLDLHDPRPWSPTEPFLYDLRVTLSRDRQRLDQADSYFGLRKISKGHNNTGAARLLINDRFEFQAGVLDAGRWPDGGKTAPSEQALRKDLELVKQLGFNLVRKPGKLEPDFWYYLCDRLGILVWQDVPVQPGSSPDKRKLQLEHLVANLGNHPAIVAWVLGADGENAAEVARDATLLKAIDPSRLVIAVGGSPQKSSRLGDADDLGPSLDKTAPPHDPNHCALVAEFGRIDLEVPGHSFAVKSRHTTAESSQDLTATFIQRWNRVSAMKSEQALSAAVFAQLSDDESHAEGLLSADRRVIKLDLEVLATAAASTPLAPQVRLVLPTARADRTKWLYSTQPHNNWHLLDADTTAWSSGPGPFAAQPAAGEKRQSSSAETLWEGEDLWIRREFNLGLDKLSNPCLVLACPGEAEVFINDSFVMKVEANSRPPAYGAIVFDKGIEERLRVGRNLLAVHCKRSSQGVAGFVDLGLAELLPQGDARLPKRFAHWPLLDAFMRDTTICVAPDGNYYLTGTTGDWGKEGIRIWKSTDLKNWDDLGLVWTPEKNATWQMRNRKRENFRLWAPEIHFLKGTFWLPYCTSYPESQEATSGTGLLKSTSGKPEGPYADVSADGPMTDGLDATLFEDDDGKVYFLHGGSSIARMKDDMSGLAEKSHDLQADGGGVGYEGISVFKHGGRYYWSATANGLPERNYDCFVAMSDRLEGPYTKRHLAVSHGGHNMFFKDRSGQWWSTIFGGDIYARFAHRPGILPVEFAPDGTIHPMMSGDR